MAQVGAEFGWRLGRDLSRRQGSRPQGQGYEHAVADCVGVDRITCGRQPAQRKRGARGSLARGTAKRRRAVGRHRVYRHRFPEALIPALSHVRSLLSPNGARSFPKENRARERGKPLCRSQQSMSLKLTAESCRQTLLRRRTFWPERPFVVATAYNCPRFQKQLNCRVSVQVALRADRF